MIHNAKMKPIRRSLGCFFLCLAAAATASAQSLWDQPAAQLATQIAAVLGAGQAQLVIVNRSTITPADLPQIRRTLEQALRDRGITTSGADSANQIRITLSENARERLWVAEIIEGNETQVAMVHFDRETSPATPLETGLLLERKSIWNSTKSGSANPSTVDPVLAALETPNGLVLVRQSEIAIFAQSPTGWQQVKRVSTGRRPGSRDPRALLLPTGDGFAAFASGAACTGNFSPSANAITTTGDWTIQCHESDDPWPVASDVKAFFNPSRNFFTGVLTPSPGPDLPPFYSIASIPRPGTQTALLLNGIDGKVQSVEQNSVKPISGTRDWGSDFAALRSSCSSGTQIIANGSGEALQDSLRAYEIPALEAIPASPPLEMGGTVTALWTAPDNKSVLAVVRKSPTEYEVDRVSAFCP